MRVSYTVKAYELAEEHIKGKGRLYDLARAGLALNLRNLANRLHQEGESPHSVKQAMEDAAKEMAP